MSFSGSFGRPIAMFSFSVNALLSQDIFYWKLTNLIIHLLCGVVAYFLIENILYFANPDRKDQKSVYLALSVASIWLLHPLHISTVLYIVQRMAQLSTLFLFAAMWSYLVARKRQGLGLPYVHFQLLTWCVFFPLSVFSKENGALFPVFVLLLELFLIQKDRISNKLMALIMIGLSVMAMVLVWYKLDLLQGGYSIRSFTLSERLLTETRVLADYLGLLLLPTLGGMHFTYDDITVSKSLFEPSTTILSISLIALLVGSAFYFRKKQPLYSLGILFFFVGHLLESTIIPLELVYEHRNYQPSLGIFLALAALVSQLLKETTISRMIAIIFLCLLTFTTWLRADSWSSEYRFYSELERLNPKSEQVAYLISQIAAQNGDYERAREKMAPFNSLGAAFQLLSIDCLDRKKLTENQFNMISKPSELVDNYVINNLVKIANLGLEHKCDFNYDGFISLTDGLLKQPNTSASNRQLIMMYKAHYLWHSDKKPEAVEFLKETHAVNPENLTPLFLACEWSIDENMPSANEICPNVIQLANGIPYKFDDFKEQVGKRYELYISEIKRN